MTTNDLMQIRIHRAPPETEVYGRGLMPLTHMADRVEVELPDGTLLCGVVTSEWDEITSESRVLTKTIHVHGTALGGAR